MNNYKELEKIVIDYNLMRMATQFKRILFPNQVVHLIPEDEIESVFKRLVAKRDAYFVSAECVCDGIVFSHQHCVLDTSAQGKISGYLSQTGHSRIYVNELAYVGDEKVIHHTLENMHEQRLIKDLDRVRYGKIDSFVAC
ncbi:hypothetical protein [Candidatus Pantoea multigeneris]|uniref:Uncharacterized protein n=1 Tax=Candidatus Pantoea multigeneris TaxID=2608357 RepID=A0ABX0RDY9_9GAMM|nr:hypothetical protein [Pantoea multigeneris]NIF21674.1 hypothetical protein [Pantoea multigeneris]